jgi:hypothetical protein
MKKITDRKTINYLAMRGLMPVKETSEAAYYTECRKLSALLEDCYIERVCFNNWMPLYK